MVLPEKAAVQETWATSYLLATAVNPCGHETGPDIVGPGP